MGAQATVSNKTNILKQLWGNKIPEPWFKRSALAQKIRKDTKFTGDGGYTVVANAPTTGGSSDYSVAIANEGPSVDVRFLVTRRKEYQTFKIDNELIHASKGDKGALVEAVKKEADAARYAFFRSLQARMWGNGGGSLGRLASGTTLAGTTFTLDNLGDHVRFEVGTRIKLASDDGSGASPSGVRAGSLKVTGIDRANGVITVDKNISTGVPSAVDQDYVFREGDYSNAMTGLPGWHPVTAPSGGESFFGVDRTKNDELRQYGYIHAKGSSTTYRSVITLACGYAAEMGIDECDTLALNPVDFSKMQEEVNKEAVVTEKEYMVNFTKILIAGSNGMLEIVSEPNVPRGKYWCLAPKNIVMKSAGECPMPLAEDGRLLEKPSDEDARRGSIGCYGNFVDENPGQSFQGSW